MSLLQENRSLKPYNTFSIDVCARYFIEILQECQLEELLKCEVKYPRLLVLGGGSNILFTKNFEGLVLKIGIQGISFRVIDNEVVVTAGGGVVWNDFVNYCVQRGFAGVENLSLIPGTVGASPVQNIGAYGVELKDVFKSCVAYEISTGSRREFNVEDCRFGYRDSIFKNELKDRYIITSVSFNLSTQANINTQYGAIQDELKKRRISVPTIVDISNVVSVIRVSKLPDPSTIGNAGSFFKNPILEIAKFIKVQKIFPDIVHYPMENGRIKLAAGWLIERCGFKGIIAGNTGTWKNQALVLVNHGKATGEEVYSFSELIINSVDAKFGVKLEREVNIL